MSKISVDTEQLYSKQKYLKNLLNEIENHAAITSSSSLRIELALRQEAIRKELEQINQQITAFTSADAAVETVESIAGDVKENLDALRTENIDPKYIESIERQLAELKEISSQTIQQLRATSLAGIEPKFSVIRPSVKLVDANLAYKFADLQSDTNILLSFTTLFLGTAISTAVNLAISLSTSVDKAITSIQWSITIMSLFTFIIFGILTLRAYLKSNKTRQLLETEVGEREIILRLAPESDNNKL